MDRFLADLQSDNTLQGLNETVVNADPFRQFQVWFGDAVTANLMQPNAMTLATASKDGLARPIGEGTASVQPLLSSGKDGRADFTIACAIVCLIMEIGLLSAYRPKRDMTDDGHSSSGLGLHKAQKTNFFLLGRISCLTTECLPYKGGSS